MDQRGVSFFVPGVPRPQGSPSIMRNRKTGRPFVLESQATRAWRDDVRTVAKSTPRVSKSPSDQINALLVFRFQRPKSSQRQSPTVKPDIDKLVRAVLDALTGVQYHDDAQVTSLIAVKLYDARAPGLTCTLEVID